MPESRKEIIYLAICNQIQLYSIALEEVEMDEANKDMAKFILDESLKIEEEMRADLQKERPISRPIWGNTENT